MTLSNGKAPWVVLVGGFLGAGKTTLLLAAARELEKRGMRSALVLNDQGDALVDTEIATIHGIERGEVTGGCFCCRFSDLVDTMDELLGYDPDVIFAEPVGSCTDISATTLQPLRELVDQYRLAPFTVLVDPERAQAMSREDADPYLRFLFENQLQEADLICLTKSDLHAKRPSDDEMMLDLLRGQDVRQVSAKTGVGVAAWLDEILSGGLIVAQHILEIDYEQYARAEAALAWLNLQVEIELEVAASPATVLGPLLDALDQEFTAQAVQIVHLKAIDSSAAGYVKAAMCKNGQEAQVEGDLAASPSLQHRLMLNLRAVGEADVVHSVVEKNLRSIGGKLTGLEIRCFHPAAPKPEQRRTFRQA